MYQSLVSSQREAEKNRDRSVPQRLFDQRVAATNVCGRFSPRIFFIRIPYNASFIRHPRYRRRLCLLIWISHRAVIIIAPVDIPFISYPFWRLVKCATSRVSKNEMRETFSWVKNRCMTFKETSTHSQANAVPISANSAWSEHGSCKQGGFRSCQEMKPKHYPLQCNYHCTSMPSLFHVCKRKTVI